MRESQHRMGRGRQDKQYLHVWADVTGSCSPGCQAGTIVAATGAAIDQNNNTNAEVKPYALRQSRVTSAQASD